MKNRSLTCAYFHSDGHMIAVFERRITARKNGPTYVTKEAEIWEQFGPASDRIHFNGRIVIHQYHTAILTLLENATGLRARCEPNAELSEKCRQLGVTENGMIEIYTKWGGHWLHDLSCLSGGFTVQTTHEYQNPKFNPEMRTFGYDNVPVVKVHFKKAKKAHASS